MEMAMEGGALKMQVRCKDLEFDTKYNAEFGYALADSDDDDSDEDKEGNEEEAKPDKITLTVQSVVPSALFEMGKEKIEFILLKGKEELPTQVIFEKIEDPSPDVYIKAFLQVTNERIFEII
jgi:hypothetical protein